MSILKRFAQLHTIKLDSEKDMRAQAPMNPNELLAKLQKMKQLPKSELYKLPKIMKKIFLDPGFCKLMYDPGDSYANLNSTIPQINELLRRQDNIRAMIDMFRTTSIDEFSRTHATFINNLVIDSSEKLNKDIDDAKRRKADGEITKQELNEFLEDCDSYTLDLEKLLKKAKKIVKPIVKDLKKECPFPKFVMVDILMRCPDTVYIPRYRIPFYMKNVMNTIYESVYTIDSRYDTYFQPTLEMWNSLFSVLFGKENLVNCAITILLEGVDKTSKYAKSRPVSDVKTSLIEFALETLDGTTDEKRTQMLDIYLKKLEKAFRNKNRSELQFDLRTVNKFGYPRLFNTVSNYVEKITDIVEQVEK